MDNTNLENYYKTLKLDERASLDEVCLAFDVLTKNEKDTSKIKSYRQAFETIMLNKAPHLFESEEGKQPIEKQEDKKENDIIQNSNIMVDLISTSDDIPILWLKEYITNNKKNFLGTEYIKTKDLYNFLDSLVLLYDVTLVITPLIKNKYEINLAYQDIMDILDMYKQEYDINFEVKKNNIIKGNNAIIIKTKIPYELYTTFVVLLNEYCSIGNYKVEVITVGL